MLLRGRHSAAVVPVQELTALWSHLPRCNKSRSRLKQTKAAFPTRFMADLAAEIVAQHTYECNGHWHLASSQPHDPQDGLVTPHRAERIEQAIVSGRQLAIKNQRRIRIRGKRAGTGFWRYHVQYVDQSDRD